MVLRTWYLLLALLALSRIERRKMRFGLLERQQVGVSAVVHSRKQPLHDLANRVAEQPGAHSFRVKSLL